MSSPLTATFDNAPPAGISYSEHRMMLQVHLWLFASKLVKEGTPPNGIVAGCRAAAVIDCLPMLKPPLRFTAPNDLVGHLSRGMDNPVDAIASLSAKALPLIIPVWRDSGVQDDEIHFRDDDTVIGIMRLASP